jgi:pimeloyl-ACP methyl ester carboxylesterase
MTYIEFEAHRIAYEQRKTSDTESADAPALVLLHGLCEDSYIWHEFIQELPDTWQIVLIDLPGFGASEVVTGWTMEYAARAVAAVLDTLDIKKCVLIGHSLGGYVAAAFAELFAERLLGVGFFHSHPFADTDERKKGREKAMEFVEKNGSVLYIKQLIPSLFARLFVSSNQFLIDSLILRAVQFPAQGIIEAQRAMIVRADRSAVLAALNCPVLFIIGKQDTVIPYEVSLAQTHLPKVASIHILPKVAHMGMFRAKNETVKMVRDFVWFAQQSEA